MATLGELEPHDSQEITLGELEPMPDQLGELVSHEDYKAGVMQRMAEQGVDKRSLRLWSDSYDANPNQQTFDQFMAEQEKEKVADAEKTLTDEALEFGKSAFEFGSGLAKGLFQMGADVGTTIKEDAPKVKKLVDDARLALMQKSANLGIDLGAKLRGEDPFQGQRFKMTQDGLLPSIEVVSGEEAQANIEDVKRRGKKAASLVAEGTTREVVNTVNAGWNLMDHLHEMATPEGIDDSRIKYERQLRNDFIDRAHSEGMLNSYTRRKLGEEAFEKLKDGKQVIDFLDPTDKDTARRLNAVELVGPASTLATPLGGKAFQALGLGNKMIKANRATNALARKIVKKGVGKTAQATGALTEKPARLLSKAATKTGDVAKKLMAPAAFVDPSGTSSVIAAKIYAGGSIVGNALGKIANGAKKARTYGKVLADSPDRHKRFLDILASEHGSRTAGLASKYYGTKAGDLLWDMTFDGAKVSALGAAEAALAGRDAEAIGEAAGGGLLGGAVLGAAFGDRGAGSSTRLVNPDGTATARSLGSFEQANINKSKALADLDQANKMGGLPDEVKSAIGAYAEMGVLPDNVILLDPKDFQKASSLMQTRIGENVEMNNSALYLPNDSTIFLNAKGKFTEGDGLRIMGEELGHHAMSNVIANDPTIVMAEAQRFSDPKGKVMLLSRSDKRRQQLAGEEGARYTRVNKEMGDFVDAYNREAEASGAPKIETFEQALQEWYGAQAGISMASNKAAISPSAPLWVHRVGLGIRNLQMKALGKSPRNTREYAKSIDQAANTPMGKYTREQYKAWVRDLEQVEAKTNEIFAESTEGSKTPQAAGEALGENPFVVGEVKTRPFEPSRKTKQKPRGLLNLAKDTYGARPEGKNSAVFADGIPDGFKEAYARQFPKSEQAAARDWIEQVDQDARRKQAAIFDYTDRKGNATTRHGIPEGSIRINDKNEVFLNYRDLTAMNYNVDKLIRENRVGGKDKAQIMQETLADLELKEANPAHQVSDLTRAVMGEKNKSNGKPLAEPLKGYDPTYRGRPLRDFNVDRIMGYGEADGNALLGQARGQEGLMFANPSRVQNIESVEIGGNLAETGKPIEFNYVKNTQSATEALGKPSRGDAFERDIEPAGSYITPVDSERVDLPPNMVQGVIRMENPIVIDGGEYRTDSSWKRVLSKRYGNLKGKRLSKAIANDGHDGIITYSTLRSGLKYPSETVDLSMFR